MKSYLKLTNFEFGRFFKIYLVLIGLTLIMQLVGVVWESNQYMGDVKEQLALGNSIEVVHSNLGIFTLSSFAKSLWFSGPIFICIVSLLIYVFFIWYRDWLGKNTFIYRLLMLPTARINVFFAKATTIFLMVLGLVSLQLFFILIEKELLKQLIPVAFRLDEGIHHIIFGFDYMGVLFPGSLMQFFINYGIGFMAVFILFTGILFERSFRLKGILLGILFAGVAIGVFFTPIILHTTILEDFFYPIEIFFMMAVTGLIVIIGSVWMSNYLLNKKIRV